MRLSLLRIYTASEPYGRFATTRKTATSGMETPSGWATAGSGRRLKFLRTCLSSAVLSITLYHVTLYNMVFYYTIFFLYSIPHQTKQNMCLRTSASPLWDGLLISLGGGSDSSGRRRCLASKGTGKTRVARAVTTRTRPKNSDTRPVSKASAGSFLPVRFRALVLETGPWRTALVLCSGRSAVEASLSALSCSSATQQNQAS